MDGATALEFSDRRLLATLGIEALLVLLWVPYLKRRGWTVEHVTCSLHLGDILRAVGLIIAGYIAFVASYALTFVLAPDVAATALETAPTGAPSLPLVVAVALLNPVFEEFLYLGYVANALRRLRLELTLIAIVALRVALHLYQGVLAFVAILPVALVFSVYYLRSGRLWPVVAAHAMMDALSLGLLSSSVDPGGR